MVQLSTVPTKVPGNDFAQKYLLATGYHFHDQDNSLDDNAKRKLRYVGSVLKDQQPDVPIVVIDPTVLEGLYQKWKKLMPRVKPHYAVKALPDPRVVAQLVEMGCSFDCASLAEIDLVLQAGGRPSRIIYANPLKIPSQIVGASSRGVNLTVFDSECELEKLQKYHPKCRALLRIKTSGKFAGWKLNEKFGADMLEVPQLLRKSVECGVQVVGVAFHVGCDAKDACAYSSALQDVEEVISIAKEMHINLTVIDIGGGFPGVTRDRAPVGFPGLTDDGPSIEQLAVEINRVLEKMFPNPSLEIISEPGSYFARKAAGVLLQIHTKRIREGYKGSAMTCKSQQAREIEDNKNHMKNNMFHNEQDVIDACDLTLEDRTKNPLRIVNGKEERSDYDYVMHYYINDGIYGNLRDMPYFGWSNYFFLMRHEVNNTISYPSIVWGPTCDSIDVVNEDPLCWPELEIGDYIFLDYIGSYQTSLGTRFNGMGSQICVTHYV